MIYLTEFRIGCFLKDIRDNEFVFVTEIRENNHRVRGIDEDAYHFFTNKSHGYCRAANYEPISLTPKILEHCGLKLNNEGYWRHWMLSIEDSADGHYGVCWGDSYVSIGSCIEYLHELQNLYFALMGQELKFDNYTEKESSDFDDEE